VRPFILGTSACLLLCLTACSGFASTPLPTYTPTITQTHTPTIAWFPPTVTPTRYIPPAQTPIQVGFPGLGSILFSDDFAQPELWSTETTPSASANMERNRLILSISGTAGVYIMTTRRAPLLGDFYAVLTAHLHFCQQEDSYGILFRAMSVNDYYRFDLNCNGQVRLIRLRSGQLTVLQDWTASGDVPAGAPGEVQIGVWMAGTEMRLFLNDRFQFAADDWLFASGTFGVFARSGAESPLMVSFTDLAVSSVAYVSPTPTATATQTSTPTRTPRP
jgi:hypothetical protein